MKTEPITRCPHCAAVFRLRPEQLQQARGWLRCGQCHAAFDATGRVLAWPADGLPAAELGARLAIEDLLRAEDRADVQASNAALGPRAAAPITPSAPSTPVLASASPSLPAPNEALFAFEQALASFPRPEPLPSGPPPASADARKDEAPARSPARGRALRRGLLALLAALLLAQTLWATRALWSVRLPVIGQTAQALCDRLGCALLPWREPQVLALEHARLVRTDTGFELRWGLHNTAAWPLVTPSIELSLLDAQEQVLVRRVLTPAESQAPALLAAQQHWSGQLAWPWPAEPPVASYRLLAFYP